MPTLTENTLWGRYRRMSMTGRPWTLQNIGNAWQYVKSISGNRKCCSPRFMRTTLMLNEFMEKIIVHERDCKRSADATQKIKVYRGIHTADYGRERAATRRTGGNA